MLTQQLTNDKLELGVRGVLKPESVFNDPADLGVCWELTFCGVMDPLDFSARTAAEVGVEGKRVCPWLIGVLWEVGLTAACSGDAAETGVIGVATAAHLDFRFCTAAINLLNSHSYNHCMTTIYIHTIIQYLVKTK